MRVLLDTHVFLWWMDDAPQLGDKAREAIASPRNVVYTSAVTAWEIVIKQGLGKLDIPPNWAEADMADSFRKLPVTWEHALEVGKLPDLHRDPFDRLLIAQARVEALLLVTSDDIITRYDVRTLKT